MTEDVNADAHGYPVFFRGMHGIGKSEVVYQVADCYRKYYGFDDIPLDKFLIERRASQMTEGDLMGIPIADIESGVTSWLPPDYYHDACENPRILFLDEIDRAPKGVRQGYFQLADSRELNGKRLHPGTKMFAAGNGGPKAGKHYQVYKMGPAEVDRWWVIDILPTAEDWLEWAIGS